MAHTVTRPTIGTRDRHVNVPRRPAARRTPRSLPQFTHIGWTPEEMRAAEQMFGPAAPVADAMKAVLR